MDYQFEICASNLQSALAAQSGGADRIELCMALEVGGLTPSPSLIRSAVEQLDIQVCVLIRPREGDFNFNAAEVQMMVDDILFCREAGAAGVVIGALDAAGRLDLATLATLRDAAGAMEVVSHRAIDFTVDYEEALEQLIDLGFHRVLSSGQAISAYEGRFRLRDLVERAAGRIQVMPGAGISPKNIAEIAAVTKAGHFHFTARTRVEQVSNHAIQGLETGFWASDVRKIRETMAALQGL